MRNRIVLAASLVALISPALPFPAAAAPDIGLPQGADAETQPRVPLPFFRHGPNETDPETFPGFPGLKGPLPQIRPTPGLDGGAGATDEPPAPPKPRPTRAEALDRLLNRLAAATDADEAKGIAGLVQQMWMQSGSDTADLLMTRAIAAMTGDRRDVAEALLDQIVTLRPGWAEAWNRRATLRFLEGDDGGAMEDISHVLALEPRHFGALSGMGFILERHGEDAAALKALRRALAVYPEDADLRKAVDKLAPTVEGQDL